MILINPLTAMITTTRSWPASITGADAGAEGWRTAAGKGQRSYLAKNIEYLVVELAGNVRELRLDKIASFSHPEIGTVVVSES